MLTYFQALILGSLQGFSELFPISSLGHSVILPQLVGWDIHQNDAFFLTFLVATHLATALVLMGFFWQDWVQIVRGIGCSLAQREITTDNPWGKLGWLLIVGTVPAGLLGLFLQDPLRSLFASARIAAFFLILNGLMLYLAEIWRRKAKASKNTPLEERLADLTWWQTIKIGAAQAIALIPGFSRSGASMAGGLLVGLFNEEAAHFSFLLATPIILAAALLKLPELFYPENHWLLGPALVGALCSGVTAYLSVKFLMRFFKTETLLPFAIYSGLAGIVFSIILLWRS